MNAIPIAVLRRLASDLATSADEVDANTAAGTFDADEAAEHRDGFAEGIRFAVDALQVEVIAEAE